MNLYFNLKYLYSITEQKSKIFDIIYLIVRDRSIKTLKLNFPKIVFLILKSHIDRY